MRRTSRLLGFASLVALAQMLCAPPVRAVETNAHVVTAESFSSTDTTSLQDKHTIQSDPEIQSEHDRLFALFAKADEDNLRRNPMQAIYRGDLRYADRLGDYGTDTHNQAERAAAQANLCALKTIDRNKLSATDQIAYDVFEYDQTAKLKSLAPEILALTQVRPLEHFWGIHITYPNVASGIGFAPFNTHEDYENNLKRHREFVAILDRYIARFQEGQQAGIVETKMTVENMIVQLDTQLALAVEESPFWGPVTMFPEDFSAADKARLSEKYRTAIADEIYPVLTRLRDYLRDSYMADAREGHGLLHSRGGERLYQHLIEQSTTLPLSAEEIHHIGRKEAERIKKEMEKIRAEVGFAGDLAAFFDHLRSDPQFKPASREALTQGYYAIGAAVDAKMRDYFITLPRTALEILPFETFREQHQAAAQYQRGTPDGSRPGRFYFNAYDLPSRTTPTMTSLYLHEAVPGHHFQISLAQENPALPAFMKFSGHNAFVEGWALYAETLGYDMGLYSDPYQRLGTLSYEMLRAMRLVVDTGIHAKGWTREQAIAYILANSNMGRTDATAEVERYIVIPAQALAYKIGALTIQRLRDEAKATLGDRFDIREFHEQVLNTGALPLTVLEKKIRTWVARQST